MQKVPVVFHNLKNYDSHLVKWEILIQNKCYVKKIEKYMSVTSKQPKKKTLNQVFH